MDGYQFTELKPRLSEYVDLHLEPSPKAGRNMFQCPLPLCGSGTRGGTGAFTLYGPGREAWKCHACGDGGDIVDLHAGIHGITTAEAARDLSYQFGLTTPLDLPRRPSPPSAVKPHRKPVDSPQAVTPPKPPKGPSSAFQALYDVLESPVGVGPAVAYLEARGVDPNSVVGAGVWTGTRDQLEAWNPQWGDKPAVPSLVFTYPGAGYAQWRSLGGGGPRWKKPLSDVVGAEPVRGPSTPLDLSRPVWVVEGPGDQLALEAHGFQAVSVGGTAGKRRGAQWVADHGVELVVEAMDGDDQGRVAATGFLEALPAGVHTVSVWDHFHLPGVDPAGLVAHLKSGGDVNQLRVVEEAVVVAAEAELVEAREVVASASVANQLDGFLERINQGESLEVPTGFVGVDQELDGGLPLGLSIVGAVSSLGKTTWVLQVADQVAASGRPVLVVSLEMGRDELVARSLSRYSRIVSPRDTRAALTAGRVRKGPDRGGWTPNQRRAFQEAVTRYREVGKNLWILEGTRDLNVDRLREVVANHVEVMGGQPPLVVVDYLQAFPALDPRMSDKQAVDQTVVELRRLARDFATPVLAVSSLNRASYSGAVSMAAFKESGSLEYGADLLLGLNPAGMKAGESSGDQAANFRLMTDHKQALERDLELVVLKNRNGKTGGTIPLRYEARFNYLTSQPAQPKVKPL